MARLPTRRGIGAPRRRGVRLPTAANVPQVTPRSDPGVTVPEGAFGNGLALEELGDAVGDVADALEREKKKREAEEALKKAAQDRNKQKSDETEEPPEKPTPPPAPEAPPETETMFSLEDDARAVKLRDVALNARMNDVLIGGEAGEGYLSSKGEAAMTAYGTTKQTLIALAEDYLGQVGNKRVRRKLEPVVAARLQGNLAAAKRHRDAQRSVADQAASQARIDNAFADATGRPDDPSAILQAQAVVYDETLQIAERDGQSAEDVRQAANDAVGRLQAGVVEALVDRDPSAAHAYLAANRDAVAPSARAELDALVQEGLIPVVAEPVAREIHANGGTPAERRAAVENYTAKDADNRLDLEATPALQQAITLGLERLDAEDATRVGIQVAEAADFTWEVVDAGGDIYSIPPTKRYLLHRHKPEILTAAEDVVAMRRRGQTPRTNPITFRNLVGRAGFHPDEFVTEDLRESQALLSPEDYDYLKELQDQLKAGGDTAKRTHAFLRTMILKANTAARRPGDNAAETFHRFVIDVRDLQILKGQQVTEADMDALLADANSEDEGGVHISERPDNSSIFLEEVTTQEQRAVSNSQFSSDVSRKPMVGAKPDVWIMPAENGEPIDIGDVETFLNSPFTGMLRGIVKFGGNVLGALGILNQNEVDDFNHMLDVLNEIAVENNPAARVGGAVGEIAGQFIVPAAGAYKAAVALGASPLLASVLSEAGVGLAGMSPNDGNLLNLIAKDSEAFSAVRDLLATDPDSSDWINRTRNAAVALATLGAGEAAIRSLIKGIEQSKRFVKSGIVQKALKAIDETDVRLKGDEETGPAGLDKALDQPHGVPRALGDLSGSGEAKTGEAVSKPKSRIHKNSHAYIGETHVYIVRAPDGTLYKIGESAQGTRIKDGASIRAEQQVRQLYREVGPGFTSIILKNFPDKRTAYTYQTNLINRYRRMYGSNTLPGNKTNR